jgi:hypothetical protein
MSRFRAPSAAAIALLLVVGMSVVAPGGRASASPAGGSARCISDNGSDVARYFDLHGDAIWLNLQGLQPPCLTVVQGHTFYRTHGWIAQVPSRAVYPPGYEPDDPAPMRDFLSKLRQARYVISRDGQAEITRTVRGPALFARAKLGRFGDLFVAPDTTLVPGSTIGARAPEWTTLEPFDSRHLPLGDHTIEIYWTLSEAHCDGISTDPAVSCLAAGESLSTSTTFTVVDRH